MARGPSRCDRTSKPQEERPMANKRFGRGDAPTDQSGNVAVENQPPPDPASRVAPPGPGAQTADTTADGTTQLEPDTSRDRDGVRDRRPARTAAATTATGADVRARQREEFGGV